MSESALTITAAAELTPFSGTTLQKYVEAWEQAFGPLPTDDSGGVRLVGPLLAIFAEAHKLRDTANVDVDTRLDRVLEASTTHGPAVVAAYQRCRSEQALTGVEELVDRLTSDSLVRLAARIEALEESRREDRSENKEAMDGLWRDMLQEFATMADIHQAHILRVAEACQAYANGLSKLSRHLHEGPLSDQAPEQAS